MVKPHEHRWQLVRSWWGDPNVINGEQEYNFWRCEECGEESTDKEETDDVR